MKRPARKPSTIAATPDPQTGRRPLTDQERKRRRVRRLRFFAARERLRQQPATGAQLAIIWPLWHALPAELGAARRVEILTGQHFDLSDLISDHERHLADLRQRFPCITLPLDEYEYTQAFLAVQRWHGLLLHYRTTVEPRDFPDDLVHTQLTFAHADGQAISRIAILRAVAELGLIHPTLLQSSSPTLADITLLSRRHAAYVKARRSALRALDKLLYKVPGIRTGKRIVTRKPLGYPLRARGIHRPPADVPHYLYIARLDALGICSPEALADCLRDDLPKLKWPQRLKFEAMRRKPRHGKNPYAGFLVWVLDNRPIFEHADFGWQWEEILQAATMRHIDCPLTCLKQWAYRSDVRLRVKLGQPSCDASGIKLSAPLLSPPPVFGEKLKPDPQ